MCNDSCTSPACGFRHKFWRDSLQLLQDRLGMILGSSIRNELHILHWMASGSHFSWHKWYVGLSINGGTPKMEALFHGKSQSKMDDLEVPIF